MTTAGDLRHRIAIERETRTPDGAGGFSSSWTTLAVRWAALQPVRGTESVVAGRQQQRQTWLAVLRRDSTTRSITPADRIVWDGALYRINTVRRGQPNGAGDRAWITIEMETD